MKKILYILGGHLEFPNYFGINTFYGDLKKLINLLQKERKETSEITLILDVREIDQFPTLECNEFWEIFNPNGENRLLLILHDRNVGIKNTIKKKKEKLSISGPLYYDYFLKDGTPISIVETELILYSIFNLPAKLYNELNGVLSLRIYLPEKVLEIPSILDKKYQKILSSDQSIPCPEINIIKEDLDLSSFTIKQITFNPFDINIDEVTKLEISKETIKTTIAEHFNIKNVELIFEKVSEVRNKKLHDIIADIHPYLTFKGAKTLLVQLSETREKLKNKLLNLTKKIKKEINLVDKVKQTAEIKIKELYESIQDGLNSELENYHLRYRSFFKFTFAFKSNFVLIILSLFLLFSLCFFLLNAELKISISLPIIFTLALIITRWLKLKKKKYKEINNLCGDSYLRVVKAIDREQKRIPSIVWNRNLILLNLKINHIYLEYIQRSIRKLKLLTENSPQNLTEFIFSAKNRLVFFVPTANDINNSKLDNLDNYMGLDKNDLTNYFLKQYFKVFSSVKIGTFNSNIEENMKDFCHEPDSGLLWKLDQVVDYREKPVRKILVLSQDQIIPGHLVIPVDDIKHFESTQKNNYQMILLCSIFELEEEENDK